MRRLHARDLNSDMREPATKQLYTTGLIARACGCSESLVRYYVGVGRLIPTATTSTGIKLFDVATLEKFRRDREERHA